MSDDIIVYRDLNDQICLITWADDKQIMITMTDSYVIDLIDRLKELINIKC